MENLLTRHKPKRGMVCLMMVGSLVLHGGLVGIASLWTPPQPEAHTVPFDWSAVPAEGDDPLKTLDVAQSTPAELPMTTATPDTLDLVPTPPPESEEPEFAPPMEPTPPKQRVTAIKPQSSANRPASSSQTAPRNPGGPSGGSIPGSGNSPTASGYWAMPHPPYPHMSNQPRAVGRITMRITTDSAGRISNVVITRSTGNPVLDDHTLNYVRNHWHGPANASRTTEFVYEVR